MGFKDWETPLDFFAELNNEFHFTLDAASSHENALCKFYLTKEGLFAKRALYDIHDFLVHDFDHDTRDGLAYPWTDHRVFCNPPYDSSLYKWVEKAAKREANVAVLLLPPSIDTAWFHDFIWMSDFALPKIANGERPRAGVQIRFLRGRLRFWRDGKPGEAPRAGNMVVIFNGN